MKNKMQIVYAIVTVLYFVLFFIMFISRASHIIEWRWRYVLAPIYVPLFLLFASYTGLLLWAMNDDYKHSKK